MTRSIAVLSGKGGVAKTTTSISLGAALTYFGKDVVIVDANLTTPNVGLHLGVPVVPVSLHHVLQKKNKLLDAVYVHHHGTKIVPASISVTDLMETDPDKLPKALEDLKKLNPDFVILDGAAGLGREALSALHAADEVLLVTNPEMPAITDALKTAKVAEKLGKRVIGAVVTKVDDKRLEVPLKNIETLLEVPILGIVPMDRSVKEALNRRDAVVFTHPKSPASVAYKRLAASLLNRKYDEEAEREGILKKMWHLLKKEY
ncbi:P-loop NTPase [Candidatus Woesearchaeota archaeon]|nr:P-loop NTPase [Candidatus Woesearchaeota archaeon]